MLRVLPEFELGLTDIEGFSHLFVIWEFDRNRLAETHPQFRNRVPIHPLMSDGVI